MKNTCRILYSIIIFGLISCNSIGMRIAKKNGDFIQPEKESNNSIVSYCREKNVKYNQLYKVKSEDYFASFIGKYKSIPTIFIFNKNKYLVTTAVKTECPWAMINLLDNSSVEEPKIIQDTILYNEIMSNFILVDNNTSNQDADYYVLCTWAKFVPKMTNTLFETINKQKEEHKINVCHILLNVDLQEGWDSK
jgi:hypothetical protein